MGERERMIRAGGKVARERERKKRRKRVKRGEKKRQWEISWERYNEASKRSNWTILSLSLIPHDFFSLFFLSSSDCVAFSFCCLTQDLFKRPDFFFFFPSDLSSKLVCQTFRLFVELYYHSTTVYYSLAPFFTIIKRLVWGSIRTFTTNSQPVYTWTLPTAFPILELLRTGETDGTHKPRWQPLGYLSRKLRNKSILLQRLPYFFTA